MNDSGSFVAFVFTGKKQPKLFFSTEYFLALNQLRACLHGNRKALCRQGYRMSLLSGIFGGRNSVSLLWIFLWYVAFVAETVDVEGAGTSPSLCLKPPFTCKELYIGVYDIMQINNAS